MKHVINPNFYKFDIEIELEPWYAVAASTIKPIRINPNGEEYQTGSGTSYIIDQVALDEYEEFVIELIEGIESNGFKELASESNYKSKTSRYYVFTPVKPKTRIKVVLEVRISDHELYEEHQFKETDTREELEWKRKQQAKDDQKLREHYRKTAEQFGATKYKVKFVTVNNKIYKSYEEALNYMLPKFERLGKKYNES